MKTIYAFIIIFIFVSCTKSEEFPDVPEATKPSMPVDGPYVFYKNSGEELIYVRTDSVKNGNVIIKTELPSNGKFECELISDKIEQFQIQLHDKIESPPVVYEQPEKLLATSDIEGNFYALSKLLIGNGVINRNFKWTFGKGHLVLVGDLFDRGDNVTACLWLLYELESQAMKEGGRVHMIMGNHEEMNLNGDIRYVTTKYIRLANDLRLDYKKLYGEDAELGRWLRSKNCVEKIGNTIYVHAGLSKKMSQTKLSLLNINQIAKDYYDKSTQQRDAHSNAEIIFSSDGPFWYRGYFRDNLSQNEINEITTYYGTEHIVVGHTVVEQIKTLYNGKIIAIDLKHPHDKKEGSVNALYMEGGIFYKVDDKGNKSKL